MIAFLLKQRHRRALEKLARLNNGATQSRIASLFGKILLVLAAHTVLIAWFEALPLGQALWLTLTTVTTVGYGDLSATTAGGQITTVALLYLLGIWMLAQLAGEYLDYRVERKERIIKGEWSWKKMQDHIVIVNAPDANTEVYLNRLVSQFRETPQLADAPIVLVSTLFPEGLPKSLADNGVVYKKANASRGDFFAEVALGRARYIVLLAQDDGDPRSDSLTLDLLDQFQRTEHNKLVVAEAVQDSNHPRFRKLGADSVLRPVRAYPELIARALAAPGTERVLEDLFGYFGASIHRYDVNLERAIWKDLACRMVNDGLGIVLGYIDPEGRVQTCPREDTVIRANALLVMARDEAVPPQQAIEDCLSQLA